MSAGVLARHPRGRGGNKRQALKQAHELQGPRDLIPDTGDCEFDSTCGPLAMSGYEQLDTVGIHERHRREVVDERDERRVGGGPYALLELTHAPEVEAANSDH